MSERVVRWSTPTWGANLHTCLGLPSPPSPWPTSSAAASNESRRWRRNRHPRLRLISGASDFLGRPTSAPRRWVLNRIRSGRRRGALDLGPASASTSSTFLISDLGLLTVVPEPTSIENGYRFIKSALYRRLRGAARNESVRELVDLALDAKNAQAIRTPIDLLRAVQAVDPEEAEVLRREMAAFHPRFIVNQVREPADVAIGHHGITCERHLGGGAVRGYVDFDDWSGSR
jgi:flagellar biosynthesis protein FlhG